MNPYFPVPVLMTSLRWSMEAWAALCSERNAADVMRMERVLPQIIQIRFRGAAPGLRECAAFSGVLGKLEEQLLDLDILPDGASPDLGRW